MPKFPAEWRIVAGKDIAHVIRGSSPRPKADPRFYGGNIPRLMVADVSRDGKYATPKIDSLTEAGARLSRFLPAGTLTIVCSGVTAGDPSLLLVDACIHDGFLALVDVADEADVEFLYYVFLQLKEQLFTVATHGGTYSNLTTTILEDFEFPLPPNPEQRKIAAILSTWDDAIRLTEQLIAALKQRKQALMQLLLTGQVRFAEFEGEAWEEVKIGQVAHQISRNEDIDPEKEYRLVGVRWYVNGVHIHETRPGSTLMTSALSRVHKGDIVYNKMWVSKAAFGVAKDEHDGAYGTSEYPQFAADPAKLMVDFMEYVFYNTQFQYEATSLCRGTTGRIRLNPEDFLKIGLSLPSLPEQAKIAGMLQACDKQINVRTTYLERLVLQKRGLMQKLLTGAIRVQANE